MKKYYSVVAVTALLFGTATAQAQSTFRDVPDNHWAAAAVKRLAEAGIIVGRPAPSSTVSSMDGRKTNSVVHSVHDNKTTVKSNRTQTSAKLTPTTTGRAAASLSRTSR